MVLSLIGWATDIDPRLLKWPRSPDSRGPRHPFHTDPRRCWRCEGRRPRMAKLLVRRIQGAKAFAAMTLTRPTHNANRRVPFRALTSTGKAPAISNTTTRRVAGLNDLT